MTATKTAQPDTTTMPPLREAPPAQLPQRVVKPPLVGGGLIRPIIPQDFDQAWRMAQVIAGSGTAPKSYRSDGGKGPIDVSMVCVAIMAGLEVGLLPMAAVQGIAVINGIPTIYGDARDALVFASGLMKDRKETIELDDDGLFIRATCTIWRVDKETPFYQEITRPQAARAGWLKKVGPWTDHPNRMAQERARGWCERDAFPDVLKGLVSYEEVKDMLDVTGQGDASTAPPRPRRSDFTTAEPADVVAEMAPAAGAATSNDSDEPDEGWPLHDQTGETVGRHSAARWVAELERMVGALGGSELVAALDNNRDTATMIAKECAAEIGSIIAEGLLAIFTVVDDPATTDSAGQANKTGAEAPSHERKER